MELPEIAKMSKAVDVEDLD